MGVDSVYGSMRGKVGSRTPTTTGAQIISPRPRPMAPPRASARRQHTQPDDNFSDDLFIDPMLGSPLAIYIEKDVNDKDDIAQLIVVSPSLSFSLCLSTCVSTPLCSYTYSEAWRHRLARLQRCALHTRYASCRSLHHIDPDTMRSSGPS